MPMSLTSHVGMTIENAGCGAFRKKDEATFVRKVGNFAPQTSIFPLSSGNPACWIKNCVPFNEGLCSTDEARITWSLSELVLS